MERVWVSKSCGIETDLFYTAGIATVLRRWVVQRIAYAFPKLAGGAEVNTVVA